MAAARVVVVTTMMMGEERGKRSLVTVTDTANEAFWVRKCARATSALTRSRA